MVNLVRIQPITESILPIKPSAPTAGTIKNKNTLVAINFAETNSP